MSAAALPYDASPGAAAAALAGIRVDGGIAATFGAAEGKTRLAHLAERGGYRLLFPRTHGMRTEAVVINTGGGVVGGDKVTFDLSAGTGADVAVTTQAAERIYRSSGFVSRIDVRLKVGAGSRLAWLPQETILFSGARLKRHIEVDLEPDAAVLLAESTVFGRIASGETINGGSLRDTWRIRRGGRLVLAEATRLDDMTRTMLDRPAVMAGAAAVAILVYVAPDAEARLDAVREALSNARGEIGASAWNGLLTVRCLASASQHMRHDLMHAIAALSDAPLPRVWQT